MPHRNTRILHFSLIVLLLITIVFTTSCGKDEAAPARKKGASGAARSAPRFPVEIANVQVRDAEFSVSAVGSVDAFEIVQVTAQVTGPTTEIPAIAFSYFDPVKSTYQTIHSDPIALSVKGGSIVGAGDVVAMAPKKTSAAPVDSELALVGSDMAISDEVVFWK